MDEVFVRPDGICVLLLLHITCSSYGSAQVSWEDIAAINYGVL
jgi:hypothetical protein